VSLFWGAIGLLPIFDYPGGRFMLEVLSLISRRRGLQMTLIVSLLLGGAYVAYTIAVYSGNMRRIVLVDNIRLPAEPILAIFMGITLLNNWELLKVANTMARFQKQLKADDRTVLDVELDYDDYDRRAK
jgi:hypothetical protein